MKKRKPTTAPKKEKVKKDLITLIREEPTAHRLIELLKPIPEEQWCVRRFTTLSGQCCFLGHIGVKVDKIPMDAPSRSFFNSVIVEKVRDLTKTFLDKHHKIDADGASVNNGTHINGYDEEHPKARILHMLEDMKAVGY